MVSTDHQLWARAPPAFARKRPGLPTPERTRVLERNPKVVRPELLPGYVWLDSSPRRLHVWAEHLEFEN